MVTQRSQFGRREPDPAFQRCVEILLAAIAHVGRDRFDFGRGAKQCDGTRDADQVDVCRGPHTEPFFELPAQTAVTRVDRISELSKRPHFARGRADQCRSTLRWCRWMFLANMIKKSLHPRPECDSWF